MLTLYYHPVSPPSRACIFLLKYLGIKHELRFMDLREKREQKEAWYLEINPNGQVPAMKHGSNFVLSESRAIMSYLINKYSAGENDAKKLGSYRGLEFRG